jgi:two-component system, chemotaxis family, CheB/CheR fusion protein
VCRLDAGNRREHAQINVVLLGVIVDLKGASVLLVDDDPDTLELHTIMLTHCGAKVRAEPSARQAVVACDEQTFDVIVSDLSMPHVDGYDFLRALKVRKNSLRVPAIALSGYAHHREQALAAGFDQFLVKPVEPKTLCRSVESLIA